MKGFLWFGIAFFVFLSGVVNIKAYAQENEKPESFGEVKEYFENLDSREKLHFIAVKRVSVEPQNFYSFEGVEDVNDICVVDNGNFVALKDKYFSTKNNAEKKELFELINKTNSFIYLKVLILPDTDVPDASKVAHLIVNPKAFVFDDNLNLTEFVPFVSKVLYCTGGTDGKYTKIDDESSDMGFHEHPKAGTYILFASSDASRDFVSIKKGEVIGKITFF